MHGAKPADVTVEQPTKLNLFVTLTIARALGIEVLPSPRYLSRSRWRAQT
jgi:hypothetical protein